MGYKSEFIPGVICRFDSITQYAWQGPTKKTTHDGKPNIPNSFAIMDGFRKWAKGIGMSPEVCEKHILRCRGRGVDILYAGLKTVQFAYEKKDKEYV